MYFVLAYLKLRRMAPEIASAKDAKKASKKKNEPSLEPAPRAPPKNAPKNEPPKPQVVYEALSY